ncbi:uncharacterized protein LOC105686522 isoform X2 [Athalia rosae]|uniref:uncharacterized protein LOC105686522 isoform X2 n=1 Tax=Athalia rosae TaxID=37344 RepID=UPI002033A178|nr:uncharacterized protein LOC105686522 isoform X2 [Athalia rosae]
MFYIQPPKGVVILNTLMSCVETRIEYLELVYNNNADSFVGNIEYLFEGSIYDKTGHFTLRLLCSTSNDMWWYWSTREIELLEYRLRRVSTKQIYRMFRSIKNSTEHRKETSLLYEALNRISTFFSQREIFTHIAEEEHSTSCKAYNVQLKFQIIPDLLKKRLVDLKNGYAIIFCSKWRELIKSLFKSVLAREKIHLNNIDVTKLIKVDPRMKSMHKRIEQKLMRGGQIGESRITIENIDSERELAGPRSEGGCPFKNFDKDELKKLLEAITKQSDMDKYLDAFSRQKPEVACATFFKLQRSKNIDNMSISSPVQYYQFMKEPDQVGL